MKNIEEIQWKLKITININRQSTEQFELSGLDIFNVKLFMLIFLLFEIVYPMIFNLIYKTK